jgi:hypothetical protein
MSPNVPVATIISIERKILRPCGALVYDYYYSSVALLIDHGHIV